MPVVIWETCYQWLMGPQHQNPSSSMITQASPFLRFWLSPPSHQNQPYDPWIVDTLREFPGWLDAHHILVKLTILWRLSDLTGLFFFTDHEWDMAKISAMVKLSRDLHDQATMKCIHCIQPEIKFIYLSRLGVLVRHLHSTAEQCHRQVLPSKSQSQDIFRIERKSYHPNHKCFHNKLQTLNPPVQ